MAGRRLTRATVSVLAGALLLAAFNAWWYTSHRRGLPLFIDESGYTAYALDHLRALEHDGLRGLVKSVENRSVQAPLVPLLTVPALRVLGEGIGAGFAVVAAFYALLIVGSYAVARRLLDPWPSALVALVVATTPYVVTFSRMYYFAVPAAAFFMVAIWCFLRSDALARPAWAVGGGAALGLAVLTRTMVLSLVVGILGAILVQAVARGDGLRRRLLTLGAATAVTVAVAATWYAKNFANVWGSRGAVESARRSQTGTVRVAGWAYSPGDQIETVVVLVDGEPRTVAGLGEHRPDVGARFRFSPGSARRLGRARRAGRLARRRFRGSHRGHRRRSGRAP